MAGSLILGKETEHIGFLRARDWLLGTSVTVTCSCWVRPLEHWEDFLLFGGTNALVISLGPREAPLSQTSFLQTYRSPLDSASHILTGAKGDEVVTLICLVLSRSFKCVFSIVVPRSPHSHQQMVLLFLSFMCTAHRSSRTPLLSFGCGS